MRKEGYYWCCILGKWEIWYYRPEQDIFTQYILTTSPKKYKNPEKDFIIDEKQIIRE